MEKTVKPEVLKMHREVVEGKRYSESGKAWEHKIKFQARFQIRGNDAILYVYPTGKNKEIWTYVSRGTPPHGIDAKNAPYLVFPYGGPGQQPKTTLARGKRKRPIPLGGPSGTRWARVKHVDHPGTDAREFEERIGKEYRPKFRKHVNKTIRHLVQEKNQPFAGRFAA